MVRIVTWNIRRGGTGRRTAIAAVLRRLEPDVAVLQEATSPHVVAWVAGEIGASSVTCAPGRSVAIVSRRAISDIRWHRLPTGRSFLEADLPEARIRLLGVHLSAGLSGRGERRRSRELDALLALADSPPGNERTLIAGDLNAIAPSDRAEITGLPAWIRLMLRADGGIATAVVERVLAAGFIDAFRRLHPHDPGLTLPTVRPTVRLDYFMLGSDLAQAATACEAGAVEQGLLLAASDHLPLTLVLEPDLISR